MAKKRTARDIMISPVITAREDILAPDTMSLMVRSGISGMPVVDDNGRVVGMVTGRLLMNTAVSGNAARKKVSEAMSNRWTSTGPCMRPPRRSRRSSTVSPPPGSIAFWLLKMAKLSG